MTIHEAQQQLIFKLYDIYDNREAANIADLVMEHLTGWKKIDRILNKKVPLLPDNLQLLEKYTTELLAHKPVQYVLNEAWFYGLKFYVNEHVLIPRPETEELVEWIVKTVGPEWLLKKRQAAESESRNTGLNFSAMFDIGTGSGCIPVAISKQLPFAGLYACDTSKKALKVAQKNITEHEADIGLLHMDFLDRGLWESLPSFDVIISNPPYIPSKDAKKMQPNVLEYEPHLALFVKNNDPFLFYKAIADFAKTNMNPGGSIFLEIHEELAENVQQVFFDKGFINIEIKKDMQGKDRMIRVKQ